MSFFELVLVASIESDPMIKPHQLEPSKASLISAFEDWVKPSSFITNLANSVSPTLAHTTAPPQAQPTAVKAPIDKSTDIDLQTAHPPSHWHVLSTVVELATEQTELMTGVDVQFQPDQLAKHSETWLNQAGKHLIDSAKSQLDPVAINSPTDSTPVSPTQQSAPSLSSTEQADAYTVSNSLSEESANSAKRIGLIERFRPRTADTQVTVKTLDSSTAVAASTTSSMGQSKHISCAHRSTLPKDSRLFQVWIGKQIALNLLDAEQAEAVAQKLRTALAQDSILQPDRFQLRLHDSQPAIYIEDALDGEPLLVVTDELAEAFSNDNTLLAIDWINNLRTTFNGTPLDVAQVQAELYDLQETSKQIEGRASWYGPWFHGRLTATGEIFDKGELTAAHPSLPFDTYLKVTNLENSRTLIVRINDRGPYIEGRNLDLSHRAAQCLGSEKTGVVPFKAVVMEPPVDIAAAE